MAAKQSSLERVFILPFILVIVCLASSVAWALYRSAEEAVDTIADAVLGKAAQYLGSAVQERLSHARITLNAVASDVGVRQEASSGNDRLPSALLDMQQQLWTALRLFPESGHRVLFCSRNGKYVGITRIDARRYEIGLRNKEKGEWTVYASAGPGQLGQAIRNETYDPRSQPWYWLAVNQGSQIWNTRDSGTQGAQHFITLSQPVYARDHALLGAVSTEISVSELARLLKSSQISRNGVAFIFDRSGKMVASSEGQTVSARGFSKTSHPAANSARLLQDAYTAFAGRTKGAQGLPETGRQINSFDFVSGGEQAQAAVVALRDTGLDWILVAAAPRSDFRGEVSQTILRNLAIGMAAITLALLLGYAILRRALFDIRRLTTAVKNIGRGEAFHSLNIERSDEIGQLAKSFQQIERSLRTDKLTSVLNRDSLIAQIDFHCSVGREVDFLRFTILFIDLDGFKQINDLYGHDEGDRVLSESAQRLQDAVRREDAVARFGGDEFVVYLHGVSEAASIAAICEKIRASLEAPIESRQGGTVRVGASIGHASFPDDGVNSDILLRIADNRMFRDKKLRKSSLQLPLK